MARFKDLPTTDVRELRRNHRSDGARLNFLEWTGCQVSFCEIGPDGDQSARWAVHDRFGHHVLGNGRTLREAIDDADAHYVARAPVPPGSH